MVRVLIDHQDIEIQIDEDNVFKMTWPVLDKVELAIKTLRDINARKTYKRLDITF